MKHYQDETGGIRALESDGSQDFLIKEEWTEIDGPPTQPKYSLEEWLEKVVRPERNRRMGETDKRIARYNREVWLGRVGSTDSLEDLHVLNQKLADLPATLTAVTDAIEWPGDV